MRSKNRVLAFAASTQRPADCLAEVPTRKFAAEQPWTSRNRSVNTPSWQSGSDFWSCCSSQALRAGAMRRRLLRPPWALRCPWRRWIWARQPLANIASRGSCITRGLATRSASQPSFCRRRLRQTPAARPLCLSKYRTSRDTRAIPFRQFRPLQEPSSSADDAFTQRVKRVVRMSVCRTFAPADGHQIATSRFCASGDRSGWFQCHLRLDRR